MWKMIVLSFWFITFLAQSSELSFTPIAPIQCDNRQGIFIRNQDRPVEPWTNNYPASIHTGQSLAIAVCHLYNQEVSDFTIDKGSLIPQLISNIAPNSSLRIDIINSANITVHNTLKIGVGDNQNNQSDNEAALINNIIKGPIGSNSNIHISVKDSANINLLSLMSELTITNASLIEELVNMEEEDNFPALNNYFHIDIQNSANVLGKGKVNLADGQLENETIDYLLDQSQIHIHKHNVANVNARQLTLFDSELSDETVDTGQISQSKIDIFLNNVGNAKSHSIDISDAELVDEVIDAENIFDSDIEITLKQVANTDSQTLTILEGELLDESMDANYIDNSSIKIHLDQVGNVTATQSIRISEGELVDEVLDAETIQSTDVQIRAKHTGNVDTQWLSIYQGELLDEIVDVQSTLSSVVKILLTNAGNSQSQILEITDGELVDEVFDGEEIRLSQVDIDLHQVANASGKGGMGASVGSTLIRSELLDEVFDSENGIFLSQGKLTISHSANLNTFLASLFDSQLADTFLEAPNNDHISVKVENSGLLLIP
ncbi:hypothetical protein [Vibrio tetraodonis]|uniref:hypothetical protein n=1 Tax=Vibrio tetraodonis TaxID=2231647 RepID=UPI000E0A4E69|nr:hypothetical protein [Vibrio tetraodonis]